MHVERMQTFSSLFMSEFLPCLLTTKKQYSLDFKKYLETMLTPFLNGKYDDLNI